MSLALATDALARAQWQELVMGDWLPSPTSAPEAADWSGLVQIASLADFDELGFSRRPAPGSLVELFIARLGGRRTGSARHLELLATASRRLDELLSAGGLWAESLAGRRRSRRFVTRHFDEPMCIECGAPEVVARTARDASALVCDDCELTPAADELVKLGAGVVLSACSSHASTVPGPGVLERSPAPEGAVCVVCLAMREATTRRCVIVLTNAPLWEIGGHPRRSS